MYASANISCANINCTSCNAGYLYNSSSCLNLCPTGFYLVASSYCNQTASQNLFALIFTEFFDFCATSIGDFSHPLGASFNDSAKLSPIPTNLMGFYFASTSSLKSTKNWIMGPDFTIRLMIYIITDGIIFTVTNGTANYFTIVADSGSININWLLSSSSDQLVKSDSVPYTSQWLEFIIYSSQQSGLFTININDSTTSFSGYEFRGQENSLNYYIGGHLGVSFVGFLAQIIADNSIIIIYTMNSPFVSCQYNQFFDFVSLQCIDCDESCEKWPWCTRSSSCNVCYSKECSSCFGYGYNQCTDCLNGRIAPDCELGLNCLSSSNTFNCINCNSSDIDGLCVELPYLYNSSSLATPVIDINFRTFSDIFGGIFQCGHNSSTYYPYNDPDSDDPFPVKNRGYYFDGNSTYLVSTSSITLNYKNTIVAWVYSMNNSCIWSGNMYCIQGYYYATIIASNFDSVVKFSTNNYTYGNFGWVFIIYSIDFVSESLQITESIDNYISIVLTLPGYAFYDTSSVVYIGKSQWSSDYWKGFIYALAVWQTTIADFYSIYLSYYPQDHLWNCNLNYYFNIYQNTYIGCNPSCTQGCSIWGTCNQCLYSDCKTCTNYNIACNSSVNNSCLWGYHITTSRECCGNGCDSCYGPHISNCYSCISGLYLLSQVCVSICPTGYIIIGNNCTANYTNIIDITMNGFQDQITNVNSGIIFSTGNGTQFYPNGMPSDPIPAYQRGYYFTSASYMTSTKFILSYNFTISLYLKQIHPGIILAKKNLSISSSSVLYLKITSLFNYAFPGLNNNTWTIIVFSVWTSHFGYIHASFESSSGSTQTINSVINLFNDTLSPLMLGSSTDSFVGFIWQLQIFNGLESVSTNSLILCSTSSDSNCLWDCDILYYLNGSNCSLCDSNCTKGCIRETDCNLCIDKKCNTCTNYSGNCTSCVSNLKLVNSTCVCANTHYLDLNILECLPCDISCFGCYGKGKNNCSSCLNHSVLQNNMCECISGYFWSESFCEKCSAECQNCSTSIINCTSCIDPNTNVVKTNSCKSCKSGYYYDENYLRCIPCNSLCKECIGSLSTQCISCANLSITPKQPYGQCSCNENEYINNTNPLQCCTICNKPCINCNSTQCLNCDSGYKLIDYSCGLNILLINISIIQNNTIELVFSEGLINNLSSSDFTTMLMPNLVNHTINFIATNIYDIQIPEISVTSNSNFLVITFVTAIIGISNSTLNQTIYNLNLNPILSNSTPDSVITAFSAVGNAIVAVVSASAVSSILIGNPPSIVWLSLNTAQLLCYVPLQNIILPDRLNGFLKSIQPIRILPNIWKASNTYNCETSEIHESFKNYDYACSYFITNTGEVTLALLCSLILLLFLSILYLITKGKVNLHKKIKDYKWDAVLRFWIESFIDIMIACILTINNVKFI